MNHLYHQSSQSGLTSSGSPLTLHRGASILATIDGQPAQVTVDGFGDRGELFVRLTTGQRRAIPVDRVIGLAEIELRKAA